MYFEGLGVDADENEAERLLLQSAENGHPNAQLSMAAFATQRGDHAAAVQWLKSAMEAGVPAAAARLGAKFMQGNGVAQNSQRANALFQSAAERGSAEGLVLLANSYLLGQGVQQNVVRARELIWEAATAGHPQAQAVYGGMLLQGRGGPA